MMSRQLTFNFEEAENEMIRQQATVAVAYGDFNNFDHAYESLWSSFEEEVDNDHSRTN